MRDCDLKKEETGMRFPFWEKGGGCFRDGQSEGADFGRETKYCVRETRER